MRTYDNPWSRQPLKTLYTAYVVSTVPFRLPYLLLHYIDPKNRENPRWSYQTAVVSALIRTWFRYISAVEFTKPVSMESQAEKNRFVTICPGEETLYNGILKHQVIKPLRIGGVWYPQLYTANAVHGKKVILHFHGGVYVTSSPREMDSGYGARKMSQKFDDALVFCPQYRLSTGTQSYFPAALQDAVTAYQYLVKGLKFEPSKIYLSGDSAGGNLVMAFIRYLHDTSKSSDPMPLPAGAMLWSPWVNLEDGSEAIRTSANNGVDLIVPELVEWSLRAFTNNGEISTSNPYISPMQHPFYAGVPIFVSACSSDVLYESNNQFVIRMREVAGNKIGLHVTEDAPHDIYAGGGAYGLDDEVNEAMNAARKFLEEHPIR